VFIIHAKLQAGILRISLIYARLQAGILRI
jgi:hypothetical protein